MNFLGKSTPILRNLNHSGKTIRSLSMSPYPIVNICSSCNARNVIQARLPNVSRNSDSFSGSIAKKLMLLVDAKLGDFSRMQTREFSSTGSKESKVTEGEQRLKDIIKKGFPNSTNVTVEDISGGCGSMYQVYIESPDFKGLSIVKQHLLVNQILQKEIKEMHGIRIQTAVPKSS